MLLKNHLDIIGRNEPVQRKARFWQSYVRALKGTDDMRAPDPVHRPRSIFRPLFSEYPELASSWPLSKSIYDEPSAPAERISTPGYRYLPVSREIYGYSPRNLYPGLPYTLAERYRPATWEDPKAWRDRLEQLGRLGPAGEYWTSPLRGTSPAPVIRGASPTPSLKRVSPLRDTAPEKQVYNYAGQPIYHRGGITRRPLSELLEPLTSMPLSRITRDPWWWDYPELRPYSSPYTYPYLSYSPYYLRNSYLSPVKRRYLWAKHPIRPFGQSIYHRGGITRRPLSELFEPHTSMPLSCITRDPWWWDYPELRPYTSPYNYPYLSYSPYYLRDSYLSPIKRRYLWAKHPIRPFAHIH